jgi:hypothetical protein
MNIHQLNESLRGSEILRNSENGDFNISRSFKASKHIGLSPEQASSAQRICDRLREFIPDDYEFDLSLFGDREPYFSLEYEDGSVTGSCVHIKISSEEQLFDQLMNRDWDEDRTTRLQDCGIFDSMLEEAGRRPVLIPSVKGLRKKFRKTIRSFHKDMREQKCRFAMLMYDSNGGATNGLDACTNSKDYEELISRIAETMHDGYWPVTICIDGKALAAEDIEEIKKEALATLAPIMRAQAEGRWPIGHARRNGDCLT